MFDNRPKVRRAIVTLFFILAPAVILGSLYLGFQPEEAAVPEEEPVRTYAAPEQPDIETEPVELPSESDKAAAQKVAAAFVETFHLVDPENPTAYVENARKWMSDRLYEQYRNIPKRGTLEVIHMKPVGTDVLPTALEKDKQIWRVGLTTEQTKVNGEIERVLDEYKLVLVKERQQWKVDGVTMNGP